MPETTIKIKRGSTSGVVPSGLTFGELAVNVADGLLFVGGVTGNTVQISGAGGGSTGIVGDYVISINGSTGAITNVAKTNVAQTFTQLQDFSAGISASYLETSTNGYVITDVLQGKSNDDIVINGTPDQYSGLYTKGTQFEEITTVWAGSNYDSDTITSAKINLTNSDTNNKTQINLKVINYDGNNDIGVTAASIVLSNPHAQDNLVNGKIELYSTDTTTIESANGLSVLSGATFTGNIYAPNIVTSVNGITGPVGIAAGSNISISSSGKTLTISGNTASVMTIGSSNVNATRYLTFVGGSGATALSIDDVTTPLTYNPQGGNIGAKKVTLTTSTNIITLDSASPNILLTDGSNSSAFGLDSFAASYAGPFTISNSNGLTLFADSGIAMEGTAYSYVFPQSNGSTGQVLTTNGAGILSWSTVSGGSGGGSGTGFTYSSSAPVSPSIGDRWIDSDTGKEYVYVYDGSSSQWIEPTSSNGLIGLTYYYSTSFYEFGGTGSFIKLGVGTTAPAYTLDVNGNANFTSGVSAASMRLSGGINGVTASFSGAVSSDSGYQITSAAINALTGTTYTLLSTDNGKIITWSNSSGVTLTVPSGLPIGFNTTIIQIGVGSVGITSSSATLNSFEGKLRLAGQHAAVSIISYASNVFNVAGGLTG